MKNKEEKKELFKPKKWNLYRNGKYVDTYDSHREAKDEARRLNIEANMNYLDEYYTIEEAD